MGGFESFFKDNAKLRKSAFVCVSDRFKDENGESMKWEIHSVSAAYDRALRAIEPKDYENYVARLCAACVSFPNLNDTALQASYGVMGDARLLKEMLLPGEYALLVKKVKEINGFDKSFDELVKEAKN